MTRDVTIATRAKVTVSSTGGDKELSVNRNHEGGFYNDSAKKDILHLVARGNVYYSTAFDLAEARQIRDAITEVILDAEQIIKNYKPKADTWRELDAQPTGTLAYSLDKSPADRDTIWTKAETGKWLVISDGGRTRRIGESYDSSILDNLVTLTNWKEDK